MFSPVNSEASIKTGEKLIEGAMSDGENWRVYYTSELDLEVARQSNLQLRTM